MEPRKNQEIEGKIDTYETSAEDMARLLYAVLLVIAMFFMIIDLSQRVESTSSSKEQTTQSTASIEAPLE